VVNDQWSELQASKGFKADYCSLLTDHCSCMDKDNLKPIIEALILASDHPISLDRIMSVLEGEQREEVKTALKELMEDYQSSNRGFTIVEVAGGYQLRTRHEFSGWIRRLFKIGYQRLSRASMETLAIIAYKQPIVRSEIEDIRGVDSGGVLKTLLEKRLIKVMGRKDVPGRPVVYGTTREFLEVFDLKDLSCLPTLKEVMVTEEVSLREEVYGGETTEGAGPGRDSLQEEGRGAHPSGQGSGKPSGGDPTGDKGRP